MLTASRHDRSLGELFGDLSRDTAVLVRMEVDLVKAEMTAKVNRLARHAVSVAIGGAVLYAGVLALVAAAVVVLEAVGLNWWASALIVGIVVSLTGYLLVQRGLAALRRASLAPAETVETMKENAAWVKGQRT
jgi:hypothetical protein